MRKFKPYKIIPKEIQLKYKLLKFVIILAFEENPNVDLKKSVLRKPRVFYFIGKINLQCIHNLLVIKEGYNLLPAIYMLQNKPEH